MDITRRNSALDITRIVAAFSVIGVHFFLNSGYYNTPMLGGRMLLLTILRTGFMICVPLFIMLTGYLMSRKEWSLRYYRGIVKTLAVYLLASIVCLVYKNVILQEGITLLGGAAHILNYSAAPYAWYIEMYIGLFLLIPFLNAMWRGLEEKRARGALVITLIFLSSLPSVFNIWNFQVEGWIKTPYLSTDYIKILPEWWVMIYPLTYYFLGAYLKEYPIKLKKRFNLPLIVLSVIAFGAFNYYRSWGGYFAWGAYTDWFGLPTLVVTVLVFVFLVYHDTSCFPVWSKKLLAWVSDACLGAYLVSYIFDDIIYTRLIAAVPDMLDRGYYFVPVTLAVFALSVLTAVVLNLIYSGICAVAARVARGLRGGKS
ncbi:MAG: acyltransferase family protein [Clostridia bacterium]|nr:acyltransferase family protein [Clostridia bacterium]